jgi:uncharacterized membrane protein
MVIEYFPVGSLMLFILPEVGHPVATVWPPGATAQVSEVFGRSHITGPYRTLTQDVSFGIDQLVEIAIRALSPAVNDTFTVTAEIPVQPQAGQHVGQSVLIAVRWQAEQLTGCAVHTIGADQVRDGDIL